MLAPGAAADRSCRSCSPPARALACSFACAAWRSPAACSSCPSFAAVQSWAPVDRRARVIAAVNVLNAAYMVGAGGIVAGLQAAGVGVPLLFAALGVLSIAAVAYVVHAWGSEVMRDAGRTVFRFFFRLEVNGLENIPGRRRARRHRPQPREPARRTAAAHHPARARGLRRQQSDRAGLVGAAVPERDQGASAGADQAAGRARHRQRREGGRDHRHLPRGPHHAHRRPDEGLRRRGHDRGQGRCLARAGAHRGPGALALRLPAPDADAQVAVPQVQGDVPAGAPAHRSTRRSGARRAARPPVSRCRTSWSTRRWRRHASIAPCLRP